MGLKLKLMILKENPIENVKSRKGHKNSQRTFAAYHMPSVQNGGSDQKLPVNKQRVQSVENNELSGGNISNKLPVKTEKKSQKTNTSPFKF